MLFQCFFRSAQCLKTTPGRPLKLQWEGVGLKRPASALEDAGIPNRAGVVPPRAPLVPLALLTSWRESSQTQTMSRLVLRCGCGGCFCKQSKHSFCPAVQHFHLLLGGWNISDDQSLRFLGETQWINLDWSPNSLWLDVNSPCPERSSDRSAAVTLLPSRLNTV